MKKLVPLALITLIHFQMYGQVHDYDDQNVIFSENGNVGIGALPDSDYKLFLWGRLKTHGEILTSQSHLTFASNSGNSVINWGNSSGGNLYFRTLSIQGDKSSYSTKMIMLNNGYLGIGLPDPQERLHINGNFALENNRAIKFYDNTGQDDGVQLMRGSGNGIQFKYKRAPFFFDALDDQPLRITNSSSGIAVQLNPNGLSFFNGGNVAIGATNAYGYKLAVNGTIGTREVVVEETSAWPDYVFSPTYQLPSLEELEIYINENHHLPNIPTAEEVEENGISLGEMNAKLLEKVEELTLHLIEQNKTNQEQSKRIAQLESELNNLKNKSNEK